MHLFAGIGGGLLADLILGHRPIVAVEWEPYACQVLRERAAEGWFPGLRVWEGDVRLFDPSEYTGGVDCIHAGFPCQDISVAGKQAGVSEGTRSGLYREVLRIAGVVRPKQLFLENVAAILGNGLGTVLADLATMGYDARWLCIRASDVGAPHHRDRWFLLADARASREDVADSGHVRRWYGAKPIESEKPAITRHGEAVSDAECEGLERANTFSGIAASAREQGKIQAIATPPIGNKPGVAWWTTEPELGRVAHGVPHRVGQLKGYGNAQVPLQAATAYRLLGGQ